MAKALEQDYFLGTGADSALGVVSGRSVFAAGGAGNCGVGRVKGPFWPQPPKIATVKNALKTLIQGVLELFDRDQANRLFMG